MSDEILFLTINKIQFKYLKRKKFIYLKTVTSNKDVCVMMN
jgi:hypothetical protein